MISDFLKVSTKLFQVYLFLKLVKKVHVFALLTNILKLIPIKFITNKIAIKRMPDTQFPVFINFTKGEAALLLIFDSTNVYLK